MKIRTLLRIAGALVLGAEITFIAWQEQERRTLAREIMRREQERAGAERARRQQAQAAAARLAATQAARTDRQPTPGSFADRFGRALKDPAFLRQLAVVQKQMITEHYGALFARLQLTPEQRERFIALLAEKQLAKTDAESAANAMIGTGLMIPAITAAQQEVNAQIAAELGPANYQAYYDFEMTDGLRTSVRRLQDSLRYTADPLSDAQAESLVAALDQVTPADQRGGIGKFTGASVEVAAGLVTPAFSAPFPDQAPEAAEPLLSGPQQAEMRRLIRQQQEELQLRSQTLAALHAAQSAP